MSFISPIAGLFNSQLLATGALPNTDPFGPFGAPGIFSNSLPGLFNNMGLPGGLQGVGGFGGGLGGGFNPFGGMNGLGGGFSPFGGMGNQLGGGFGGGFGGMMNGLTNGFNTFGGGGLNPVNGGLGSPFQGFTNSPIAQMLSNIFTSPFTSIVGGFQSPPAAFSGDLPSLLRMFGPAPNTDPFSFVARF
jgi:hypothetical protein